MSRIFCKVDKKEGLNPSDRDTFKHLKYFDCDKFNVNGEVRRFKNRFATISYSLSFPVMLYTDLIDNGEATEYQKLNETDFVNELKKIVATKSFTRSLSRAKNQE